MVHCRSWSFRIYSGGVTTQIDLTVTGMTCTSCAARVERRLNRLPGVTATVNFATESAQITIPDGLTVADVVKAVEETGYGASALGAASGPADEIASLRRRFWICLVLAIPVMALSMIPILRFTGWEWAALVLTLPIVTWGAWPVHRATWINARHRAVTMDTLISLGVGAAFIWSLWVLLFASGHGMEMNGPQTYFEVAAVVPVFILAGRWSEVSAKFRSSSALRALMDLSVPEVSVLRDGVEVVVSADILQVGDVFVVRPGERIATDGMVEEGASCVDESLFTGESLPVDIAEGSQVTGGTMNIDGRLLVRASRVGSDTRLAQVARLVVAAQMEKAPIQRLVDRVSAVFVPVVMLVSLVTLAAWWFITHDAQAAFTAAVAVLIIACPCALGLATPIALLVGTGRGAQIGILIRGPQVLEDTRRVNTIVLDKTGTVTMGAMSVLGVAGEGVSDATVLQLAASAEIGSEHPVARAIVAAAGSVTPMREFSNARGAGVQAMVGEEQITIGRPQWVAETVGSKPSDNLQLCMDAWGDVGATVVAVAQGTRVIGAIAVADKIRPTSARAVSLLRDLGLRPVLLTGDHERAARAVAIQVGITDVVSDVMPEDKVVHVTALQAHGSVVAMVGDGVNDAAALATADLGIAMGSGSDVAAEASDLTLVRSDLLAAVDAIRLSRKTLAVIRGNLFWAFAYNVAMIPLAAAGVLNPMLAGAAMASSSVFVVANSLRLRRFVPTT